MPNNPEVVVEVKDIGLEKTQRRIGTLKKSVADLAKEEDKLTGSRKKSNQASQDNARSSVRQLREQQKAIEKARQEMRKMNTELVKTGRPAKEIDKNVASFNRFSNAMNQGKLKARDFAQVQAGFEKRMDAVSKATDRTSRSQKRGATVINNYRNSVRKSGNEATKTAKDTGNLNNSLRNLSSSAVLAVGPLSGIGARIIALGAISQRSDTLVKGLVVAFGLTLAVGAVIGLTKAVKAGKLLEEQMNVINAVLKATGKEARISAQDVELLAEKIDAFSLGSGTELRAAAARVLTFKGIEDLGTLERVLTIAQDIAAVDFTNVANAATRLGRAIEDPIANLDAFRRTGIQFSNTEKELISTLVNFRRDTEATNIVLEKFGKLKDAARERAKGLAGSIDNLVRQLRRLAEQLGEELQGPFKKFIDFLGRGVAGVRILAFDIASGLRIINQARAIAAKTGLSVEESQNLIRARENEKREALLREIQGQISPRKDKPSALKVKIRGGQGELRRPFLLSEDKKTELSKSLAEIEIANKKLGQSNIEAAGGVKILEDQTLSFIGTLTKNNKLIKQMDAAFILSNPNVAAANKAFRDYNNSLKASRIREQIIKPSERYAIEQKKINNLLKAGAINAQEYGRALAQIKENYISTDKVLGFLVTSTEDFIQTTFDGFVEGASAVDVFRNSISNLLKEMSQLILKLGVINPLINDLFKTDRPTLSGNSIIGQILGGAGGFFSGLFGGGGGVDTGAAAIAGTGDIATGLGFAKGGQFSVGGTGGTDSQFVPLRLSPGEDVTIRTPSEARRDSFAASRGSSGKEGKTFFVDMRGASEEAVIRLERMVRQLDASLEERAVSATTDARARDPHHFDTGS